MESKSVDLNSIRSRIDELSNFLVNSGEISSFSSSESEKLLQEFVIDFENKVSQIVSEHSDVGSFQDEDLDAYMDRLRVELKMIESESASIYQEIEDLAQSNVEGTCKLESNLETLDHAMYYIESKGLKPEKGGHVDNVEDRAGHVKLSKEYGDDDFQILSLKQQIETNKLEVESLQDLDLKLKRLEAIEKIEEALTGLKVIDFGGNYIRVSLRTCIPPVEDLLCQLKAEHDVKLHEVSHELQIDVMDGSMELKNVEIFPNDVHIGEIAEAANSFSKLFSLVSVPETRSMLGWFLQKVQDRIVTCTMRQLIVKLKSRHSFEYVDKEELIIAHMDGGVDVFIKPSQGWPLSMSALKLVSLRSSDQNARGISLSLLSKVEEAANSLDVNIRKSITDFVDGIEEILLEKMRADVH